MLWGRENTAKLTDLTPFCLQTKRCKRPFAQISSTNRPLREHQEQGNSYRNKKKIHVGESYNLSVNQTLLSIPRREGDSNPRYALGVYTLSRRASSTTRASLQILRGTKVRFFSVGHKFFRQFCASGGSDFARQACLEVSHQIFSLVGRQSGKFFGQKFPQHLHGLHPRHGFSRLQPAVIRGVGQQTAIKITVAHFSVPI